MLGQLADIRGRWAALYVSFIFGGVAATLSAVSFEYWQYLMCKFVLGFGCGGIGVASFVLSTEPLGAKWRAVLGIATQYWWAAVGFFVSFRHCLFRSTSTVILNRNSCSHRHEYGKCTTFHVGNLPDVRGCVDIDRMEGFLSLCRNFDTGLLRCKRASLERIATMAAHIW
jgi:hypothetical protein|mmetsp:Transcript_25817/g.41341  ORF Transcript_25817/g.41341 Transcript_25817/m.41341 type:complete len:170 (-) Transcript_25817:2208-2717(-)